MESKEESTRPTGKIAALRSSSDFQTLAKRGNQVRPASWLTLRWQKNQLGHIRLGCSLPRYVGNAVLRNRLRRWVREFVRHSLRNSATHPAVDLHLVFRRQDRDFYRQLEHKELDQILAKGLGRAFGKN